MKKYQLTGQPIYVGETYNHNGDLYRVESFDEGYGNITARRATRILCGASAMRF